MDIIEEEKLFWDKWIFQSHKWVEYKEGYYECSYCNATHKEGEGYSKVSLCFKNSFLFKTQEKPHTYY